jgi:hypothetical protein
VVVGGYDDLEIMTALTTTIEVTPQTNETVQIVRSSDIEVDDGMLVLQILNEEFTRAASGRVRFTLENTGEAEIEIITARNSGKSPSDHIIYYLVDEDENVLTSKAFTQAVGDKTVTLSNRNTVARIGVGQTFTSDVITIPIPANAPDEVTLRLDITNIYYLQDQTTQVTMKGLSTTHQIAMVDTTYYGEVATIVPQSSAGDQDIVITGQAVGRVSGDPMANVPLNLVITVNGFERAASVYTGEDGIFNHHFKPLIGESGVYKVRAVHPERTDKPVHGQFVINRVSVTPTAINLQVPKNYSKTVSIRVDTGEDTGGTFKAVYGDHEVQRHICHGITADSFHSLAGDRDVLIAGRGLRDNSCHLTIVGCIYHGDLMGGGKPFHGDLGGLILVIINIGDIQAEGDVIGRIGRDRDGDNVRGKGLADTNAGHTVLIG